MNALDLIQDLRRRMAATVIGRENVIQDLPVRLPANGNLLVEGLPGPGPGT